MGHMDEFRARRGKEKEEEREEKKLVEILEELLRTAEGFLRRKQTIGALRQAARRARQLLEEMEEGRER